MEKQSLIKYRCALFLVLILLISSNNMAIAQPASTPKTPVSQVTVPPSAPPSSGNLNVKSTNNSMLFPVILSILALVASGGAIALTILKNKKINDRIEADDEKHTNKIKSLEKKYNDLLIAQITTPSNQQRETSNRNFENSSNTNVYLESEINSLSERIRELENRLQLPQNNEQSINLSKNYSYQYLHLETDINPFNQIANISQTNRIQPSENLAYIELVNTYDTNPRILEQKAVRVSEAPESINRRHSDSSQKIVLEQANNPNYWVVHDDAGITCWLLPKSKLKIDQYRYETTKVLFECNGYQQEYSSFKLVKPAKVISLSDDEQTWQLEEPGILEFTVEV